jgi:hypothetical protein
LVVVPDSVLTSLVPTSPVLVLLLVFVLVKDVVPPFAERSKIQGQKNLISVCYGKCGEGIFGGKKNDSQPNGIVFG